MVKIRLSRVGSSNQRKYRIVVADKQRARGGAFIEVIGSVDETIKPRSVILNKEKYESWIAKGAQPTDTVYQLANS